MQELTTPETRHTSSQAWRRLRAFVTDNELRDIAMDIAMVLEKPVAAHPIAFALIYADWEKAKQL